jgi:hypothetical protein
VWGRDMMGEWKSLGSPCIGGTEMERAFTFFSQDTFVLPVPGLPGRYIYMGDQWETENLGSSRCGSPLYSLPRHRDHAHGVENVVKSVDLCVHASLGDL